MASLRAYLFGFATVLAILLGVLALDRSYQDQFRQEARLAVLTQLTAVRARLEGTLLSDLSTLSALAAFAANFPEAEGHDFRRFAGELVEASPRLRAALLALDDRIRHLYVRAGTSATLPAGGDGDSVKELERMRASHDAVLSGPLVLGDGSRVLIGRQPLFGDGGLAYRGHVAVVIDLEEVISAAGLNDDPLPIRLAVRARPAGIAGTVFHGDAELFRRAAVRSVVALPGGTWSLAAEPADGWMLRGDTLWLLRLMGIFVAGTCAALVFVAFRFHERIQHKALHDELTGLPNRVLLSDRLDQALASADRGGHRVAVLALDLDDFKPVNDTMGHEVGDEVLRSVAERLRNLLRGSDSAARLGGDEFVVVLSQIKERGEAGEVARRIIESVAAPYQTSGGVAVTGVSVGISVFPEDGDTWQELLTLADFAMYDAKHLGKNRFCTVKPEQRAAFRSQQATAMG